MWRKDARRRACAVDGVYAFRLGALREKWEKIVRYIPAGFSVADLKKFCDFLAEESRNKIYLKGSAVYGQDFCPLRRSRLTGRRTSKRRSCSRTRGSSTVSATSKIPLGIFCKNIMRSARYSLDKTRLHSTIAA